jgi:hypothetical protein
MYYGDPEPQDNDDLWALFLFGLFITVLFVL